MRFSVTDKFLFDLYDFLEKSGEVVDLRVPSSMKKACYPEIYELKRKYQKEKSKQQFSQLVYYLKKKGYIKIKNLEQKKAVMLTPKGTEKVLRTKFKSDKKQKRKDGRWQMIIFDIPEEKRFLRSVLRERLQLLKYKMLQRSVWVCPYDVQKEIEFVLKEHSLDQYVKLFLIEEIET